MNADEPTSDTTSGAPSADHDPTPRYEIRVRGRLGARWEAWFDGLTLTAEPDGTTAIRGPVADQAALHGVLQKVRDLGIPLVSITALDSDAPAPRTHEGA